MLCNKVIIQDLVELKYHFNTYQCRNPQYYTWIPVKVTLTFCIVDPYVIVFRFMYMNELNVLSYTYHNEALMV